MDDHARSGSVGEADASSSCAFRSPPRILIPTLCRSRDAWKAKAQLRNAQLKTLKVRVADVNHSRDDWRQRAEEAQLQISQLQQQLAEARQRIDTLEQEKKPPLRCR
jgi:predicted  nucleic acid-binding Zn-ribbon protein